MTAGAYNYEAELEAYQRHNPRSAARFASAQHVLAGGNSRLTAYFAPFPFYVERGEGCRIYDLDGNDTSRFLQQRHLAYIGAL